MADPNPSGAEAIDLQLDALRKQRKPALGLRVQILAVLSVVLLVTIVLIGLAVLHIA